MPEDVEKIVVGHKREGGTREVVVAARPRWLVPVVGSVAQVGTMLFREIIHVQLVQVPRGATRRRVSPFLLWNCLLACTQLNASPPVVGVSGSSERVRCGAPFARLLSP